MSFCKGGIVVRQLDFGEMLKIVLGLAAGSLLGVEFASS